MRSAQIFNSLGLVRSQRSDPAAAEAYHRRALDIQEKLASGSIATHGILDERFPLNSALVFSIPEAVEEGRDNGLLQAWEIFEQVRIEADLVVLSACQTGLGQEVNGEGLVGLTRAFHFAGARSVLASLWNVDDRRTTQLMKYFYEYLGNGESKDQALREAQLKLLRGGGAAPFYWAGFTLDGDWH